MPSVRELIIETELQVQKLGGAKRSKIQPQQIVWRLNTAQARFIKNRLKADDKSDRFEINQKSRIDLSRIIKPNLRLRVFKDTPYRGYAYLPPDFGWLINDRSVVLEDCKEEFVLPVEVINYTAYVYRFTDSLKVAAPYYSNLGLFVNNVFNNTLVLGAPSVKESFEFVSYYRDYINEIGAPGSNYPFTCYWERYGSLNKPNCFIVVAEGGIPNFKLTVDGTDLPLAETLTITENRHKKYNSNREIVNRNVKNDYVYDINNNYYTRPTPDSPVSSIADGKIFFHFSERFLVSEVLIDYVRKPGRISLYLNRSSELDETVHDEICGLAAESILSDIQSPSYPEKVNDNISRIE